ncbi:MAG: hypothetical protein KF729_20235 [Sandaracinaceae bacterium]|nr:hypothetical protein [Sandaracinaceae bacterium]
MSIETSGNVRAWFYERLEESLNRQSVPASGHTRLYLVELLARYAERPAEDVVTRPLVLQLAEALEASGPDRLAKLRSLGDAALYALGFFEDFFARRGVSRSYVVTMGGRAYADVFALAAFSPTEAPRREVYGELAEGFEVFVEAIDDVRESTALATPQDIVRLYEKWKRTRSPKIARRLRSEGVFPALPDDDDVLH